MEWTVRPFAKVTSEIRTRPFYIPQNAKNYSEFKRIMEDVEKSQLQISMN